MQPIVGVATIYYTFGIIWALVFAGVCGFLASRKGHSFLLWGILGFFFSIITLIVVLILPRRRR